MRCQGADGRRADLSRPLRPRNDVSDFGGLGLAKKAGMGELTATVSMAAGP